MLLIQTVARIWENVWIMPNPGDAGSSLGAAALTYGKKLNWEGPFLGYTYQVIILMVKYIKELMSSRQIVGVANGRAEFGPRALGNRTLFADPRGADIKDKVNEIKRRQKFRPFAPMILEEYADEYFDMPKTTRIVPDGPAQVHTQRGGQLSINFDMISIGSPFMQFVARCRKPEEFPAIVHADGTSRVQTVGPHDSPNVRKLLTVYGITILVAQCC